MKVVITNDVTHKVNGDYVCVLVQFEDKDTHFFKDKMNWLPKDSEVLTLVKLMVLFSDTFKSEFNQFIKDYDHAKA